MLAAVLLTSMFMNAGNYGMPLVNFAFGAEALVFAGLMFVAMNLLMNSVGIVIASLGTSDLRKSLLNLFKIPAIYAVSLGVLFLSLGWELPKPVGRTVEILGNAAIPCMLVFMGLQFHNIQWKGNKIAHYFGECSQVGRVPCVGAGYQSLVPNARSSIAGWYY